MQYDSRQLFTTGLAPASGSAICFCTVLSFRLIILASKPASNDPFVLQFDSIFFFIYIQIGIQAKNLYFENMISYTFKETFLHAKFQMLTYKPIDEIVDKISSEGLLLS